MIIFLKFLHLFSLLLGGAAAGGNIVLGRQVGRSVGPPPPMVARAMGILGNTGFLAIVLLWLTGLPLAYLIYGTMDLGGAFGAKLIFATLILGLSLAMNVHAMNAKRNGKPPAANFMRIGGMVVSLSMIIAVALAAGIFATSP